jgi:4-hydroxy-tetrahydrodipicolinate reductase
VVGATGRFGRSVIAQTDSEARISGAVCSDSNPLVGKKLREAGIHESDTVLTGASEIETAAADSDVVLFVSKPDADLVNVPKVAAMKKRIVLGTTGFTPSQTEQLTSLLATAPSIIASNFSVGANILFQIAQLVARFSNLYDYSVVEEHHKRKIDAPSGTAKTMIQMLNYQSAFPTTVTDRSVRPRRAAGEIEMVSLRGGGTPGIHQLIMAGENDMIRIEHIAFSRAAGASGAVLACKWIASKQQPGVYSMQNVLGLSGS